MRNVVILGKKFVPYINEDIIQEAICKSAEEINECYKDATVEDAPIFVSILNGAFMYTSDLMKKLTFPCELSFIKVSSYNGTESSGKVVEVIGMNRSIEGRDVILIDDIVDSGLTMMRLKEIFEKEKPRSIKIAVFMYKDQTCCKELKVDFPSIIMKDDAFIIGYGLDYNEIGRNLRDIYILEE